PRRGAGADRCAPAAAARAAGRERRRRLLPGDGRRGRRGGIAIGRRKSNNNIKKFAVMAGLVPAISRLLMKMPGTRPGHDRKVAAAPARIWRRRWRIPLDSGEFDTI